MLPASNRGAGMSVCFPDVCNTIVGPATVPLPYPNVGLNAQAVGFSPVVKISMVNALNLGSKIAMTMGDEAGAAHPTIKGQGGYTTGNPVVSIDRLPAVNLTCQATGNAMNAPMGAVLVPSAVNVLMCREPPPGGAADVARLVGGVLRGPSLDGWDLDRDEIGALRVTACGGDLGCAVLDRLLALEEAGARAIVVDLRGNPGGDLEAAVALASALLPDGAIVAHVRERDGAVRERRAHGRARCLAPLVLVVDHGTASSAELLALGLQHHARALVVGEPTRGKGWAWRASVDRHGRTELRPDARWSGPDGQSVEGAGVRPDLEAPAAAALGLARAAALELVAPPGR